MDIAVTLKVCQKSFFQDEDITVFLDVLTLSKFVIFSIKDTVAIFGFDSNFDINKLWYFEIDISDFSQKLKMVRVSLSPNSQYQNFSKNSAKKLIASCLAKSKKMD